MGRAQLRYLEVTRFKSYRDKTRFEFKPLTMLVGRNSSGKSTIIQALLLLKQTLLHKRSDVRLHLEGDIDAVDLRELTFGHPEAITSKNGPVISLCWTSDIDVDAALDQAKRPSVPHFKKYTAIDWLDEGLEEGTFGLQACKNLLELRFVQDGRGAPALDRVVLRSEVGAERHEVVMEPNGEGWRLKWDGNAASKIDIEFEHFVPYPTVDRSNLGPRLIERQYFNGFLLLFSQPLEDLQRLLERLSFLSSLRTAPQSIFKASTTPPEDIGASGEYAAELLHARRQDVIHYLPPLGSGERGDVIPSYVKVAPFIEAMNDVFSVLEVDAPLELEDVERFGFRLLFGTMSLNHVGRGLTFLLPIVELGLFADPLRFEGEVGDLSLDEYAESCRFYSHVAIEEPEAHIHPKLQSRLAHWFVALAMANRRLIVETHSDHLVRRLRKLIARAEPGSDLETWLLDNVAIIEVRQDEGCSSVATASLTSEGSIEDHWPSDFMDEASEEESAIYSAMLEKRPLRDYPAFEDEVAVLSDDELELEDEP